MIFPAEIFTSGNRLSGKYYITFGRGIQYVGFKIIVSYLFLILTVLLLTTSLRGQFKIQRQISHLG
jgi:hypothetical protein